MKLSIQIIQILTLASCLHVYLSDEIDYITLLNTFYCLGA